MLASSPLEAISLTVYLLVGRACVKCLSVVCNSDLGLGFPASSQSRAASMSIRRLSLAE